MPRDLVVTWPKSTPLPTYVAMLKQAERNLEHINFRVAAPPLLEPGECKRVYMVHDGRVRGWSPFVEIARREFGEVQQVRGGGYWPEGWYIVREPLWFELPREKQTEMRGFQGFRYTDRERD